MEVMISKGLDFWFSVFLVMSVSAIRADSQLDSEGFISIDCGIPSNTSSVDVDTELTYVSDDQFIDTGVNYRITSKYATNSLVKQFLTVRSFPNGTRNCYTLRSLSVGSKYLVRATFLYGNYDNLNKLPIFDVHLGVNYWATINITSVDYGSFVEIITTTTTDYLQVCLINKDLGTPFISGLDLRPLETSIYKDADFTHSLVNWARLNLGANGYLRYPVDPYDRFWVNYTLDTWTKISTSSTFESDTTFATPSLIMQTAATTLNTEQPLNISWTSEDESTKFLVILHIGEIQDIPRTSLREFDIYANEIQVFNHSTIPSKLYSGWAKYTHTGHTEYNVSLKATADSTLPPLLNAFELYVVTPVTEIPTYSEDVAAMNAIKTNYKVKKGWSGDPCVPTEYSWTGVTCTSDSTNIPRITTLNLSSSGLTGAIVSSFASLSSLKSLDLSYNDLSGDLPTFLDQLSALSYLDITGNYKISTTLPPDLQKRNQDGSLTFRFGKAPSPSSTDSTSSKKNKKIPIVPIAVAVVVVLLLIAAGVVTILCLKRRKYNPKQNEIYGSTPANNNVENYANNRGENAPQWNNAVQNYANKSNGGGEGILNFENRRFSYNDLNRITNNFHNNIGMGGFGSVYVGALENGTQVAVKMRSHSSSQGVKEFLAEAQNLTRVHHKHLVSLIGYCMDGDCMALVYEYMQQGTLQDKLRDSARPLTWKQRLRVAYESALGLDYLHKACNPPLIHRDVKTSNILLNTNLEAKIADFGLARAFNNDVSSHVSTAIVGTPGYLDPEYYSSYQLSEKSDVFSFGVVLLEIITGQPPIIAGPEGGHLKQWVNQKLSRGEIESIVDPRMHGQYDINSVWKVTDLARKCTEKSSAHRPTMNAVVTELKESLDLEISTEMTHGRSTTTNPHNHSRNDNSVSDFSQSSVFEMAYIGGTSAPGPIAR